MYPNSRDFGLEVLRLFRYIGPKACTVWVHGPFRVLLLCRVFAARCGAAARMDHTSRWRAGEVQCDGGGKELRNYKGMIVRKLQPTIRVELWSSCSKPSTCKEARSPSTMRRHNMNKDIVS